MNSRAKMVGLVDAARGFLNRSLSEADLKAAFDAVCTIDDEGDSAALHRESLSTLYFFRANADAETDAERAARVTGQAVVLALLSIAAAVTESAAAQRAGSSCAHGTVGLCMACLIQSARS